MNNKFYIGMHSTSNLEDGYIGSGKRLWYAIRKYGKENFNFEILEWFSTRKLLKEREIEIVNEELLQDSQCMNLSKGGEGGFKMSQEAAIQVGKRWNQLHQYRLKTDSAYRKKFSDAISKKQSGEKNSFFGKSHTEEFKQNMSKQSSITQRGQLNSQFGKIWIFNESESKLVKKEDIESFLSNGWKKGRKIWK